MDENPISKDPILTMDEYITSTEEDQAIVLGGVDGEPTCTFPRGYLKRQAVYCCKTCSEISGKRAGICYECSIQCHNEHTVVELYTKRSFRCDCGNSNFKGASDCQLWEEKDDVNIKNHYDQTFNGLFCTCSCPYPDPNAEVELEMFQCGICEDWFHLNHIGLSSLFKPNENYEEMTCTSCVKKFPILWMYYYQYSIAKNSSNSITKASLPKKRKTCENKETTEELTVDCRLPTVLNVCQLTSTNPSEIEMKKLGIDNYEYPLPIFWPTNWRTTILCTCSSCQNLFRTLHLDFLMDEEDSISFYMEVGKKRVNEIESNCGSIISTALSELPHTAAVNVARGITKLKTAMQEFLLKEREKGHVITEEEVKTFCDELKKDLL